MEASKQATDKQKAKEEAAQWVVRLSACPGADERDAFEAWRAASLDHEIAYARASATWDRLDRLSSLRDPTLSPRDAMAAMPGDGATGDEGHEVPSRLTLTPVPSRRQDWRQWGGLAASLLLVVSIVTLVAFFLGVTPSPAYATGLGERRVVMLADGTQVELNTNSSIVVHYASGRRSVDLERGEAVFRIARDPRPFEVRAGQVQLHAVRTAEMGVRLLNQGAKITVMQGQVSAQDFAGGTRDITRTLTAGSTATVAAAVFNMAELSDAEIRRALAWRQGSIALNGETLVEAADEFNRYNHRQIHVIDPQVGALHVGGFFDTSDLDGFLRAVTNTFPVRARADSAGDVTIESNRVNRAKA